MIRAFRSGISGSRVVFQRAAIWFCVGDDQRYRRSDAISGMQNTAKDMTLCWIKINTVIPKAVNALAHTTDPRMLEVTDRTVHEGAI